jgi:hypothetical protein
VAVARLHNQGTNARIGPIDPSRWIRFHEDQARDDGSGAILARAEFASPGFFSVDGSGALTKVMDILHCGELQNEEREAIIQRI